MKIVKTFAFSLVGLGAILCAGASADQPATRPSNSDSAVHGAGQVPTGQFSGGQFQSRKAMRKANNVRLATQQEWDDMMIFMREYSPARARVLDSINIPHDSPVAVEAMRKFRNYVFTLDHLPDSPAIADDLRLRFQKEDDLFALMLEDRAAANGNDSLELRDKIHDKVGEIVRLEVKTHQERIERLEKMLADEKNKLAKEEASEDDTIERRTDQVIGRLQKHNGNLSPPTSRPDDPGVTEDVPASATHAAALSISTPENTTNTAH